MREWTRACLVAAGNDEQTNVEHVLLYTLIADSNSPNSRLYLERRLIRDVQVPRTPKFKTFPYVDIRLPSDFFYPFTCNAFVNLPSSSAMLIAIFVAALRL